MAKPSRGAEKKEVRFNLLISEQVTFNPNDHKVFIEFVNIKKAAIELLTSHSEVEGIYKLSCSVKLSAELITDGKYLTYTYVLVRKNGNKEKEEHVKSTRYIEVPKSAKKKDIWHQHDGFFKKKPDGWTTKIATTFKNWWNDLAVKHAETYCMVFFPELTYDETNRFPNFLLQLEMLFHGMKKVYLTENKCWKDDEQFKTFVSKQCIDVLNQRSAKMMDKEHITVFSLSLLLALYITKFDVLTDTDRAGLSELLMTTQDVENKTCPEFEAFNRVLENTRDSMKQAFIKLAEGALQSAQQRPYLILMPWVHFLNGECIPYKKICFDMSHDENEPRWWGVTTVKKHIDTYKRKCKKWDLSQFQGEYLSALFQMDYLLPRSIIATADLKDLATLIQTRLFPVEVILANLIYHLKSSDKHCFTRDKSIEQHIRDSLDVLLQNLEPIYSECQSLEVETKMSYKLANQIVLEYFKANNCNDPTAVTCIKMFLSCVVTFERYAEHENEKRELFDDVRKVCSTVQRWMNGMNLHEQTDKETYLKVWNMLYMHNTESEVLNKPWKITLADELAKKFDSCIVEKGHKNWFVRYYCTSYENFSPSLQVHMSKIAFKAVKEGYTQDVSRFENRERKRFGELLSKFFLSEWTKFDSESANDGHMLVKFLLNWSAFSEYLKIYNDKMRMELLSDDCVSNVVLAASKIEHLVETLLNGSITVEDLNLITSKREKLLELIKVLQITVSFEHIANAIKVRENEFDSFKEYVKQVSKLSSMCQSLNKVDKTEIDIFMRRQIQINQEKISDLCEVQRIDEDSDILSLCPKPIGFEKNVKVNDILQDFYDCCTSTTFVDIWFMKCKKVGDSCKTFDDVLSKIWKEVKECFERLKEHIEAGDTTFKEFERLFSHKYGDDDNALKQELQDMDIKADVIDIRIDQLHKFQQLQTCMFGAKSILQFVRQYELTGDFDLIRTIASYEENDMKMKAFDDTLISACKTLQDLKKDQANCLQAFLDCKDLIAWLKDSMENSGLKELKVFVDLALMSAGEEPMNIARVQCLHTAVTGYAPLIFDLQKDAGFEELLQLCRSVWKELEANPSLPDKLIDTARHLQWLDTIQKAHGSVEITSMMQVEACNDYGEYTIGSDAWPNKDILKDTKAAVLNVQDILKLTVPGDEEGSRETRNYTTEHLQDLQSRLMLVAGNSEAGAERVEKFTMIFDGALRLSNVYVKLCSSGCVLFKNWTVWLFCDPERPVCAILEFGDTDCQLKGRQSNTEELRDIIPKLAGFMESCFDKWMDFIKQKRKKYRHLNYFTTDQLVILQRELVKIGTNEEPSHLIYPLLSAVKPNCTRVDLHVAMTDAKTELDVVVEEAKHDEPEVESKQQDDGYEEEIDFINSLIEQGFSASLARKAFKHVGPDASDGFEWCMEHADEDNDDDESLEETPNMSHDAPVTSTFTMWNESSESFLDIMTSRIKSMKKQGGSGSAPLIDDLKLIWKEFLDSISSNIQDYLSLEHLGLILKHLDSPVEEIERKFPPNFEEGSPNLIICRLGEVLVTALSLYVYDNKRPLPHSDEMLLCTNRTNTDEVDIFFRGALVGNGKKIHCLVNADLLRYDVSEQVEKLLEDYLLESRCQDQRYKMVVICTLENEYRSTLVTFLDKYKRTPVPIKSNCIKAYLKEKFICPVDNVDGVTPAAVVDKERLTVRVVKSWRAGVGKTLFKNRREEDLKNLNQDNVASSSVSIPLQDKVVNTHNVVQRLLEQAKTPDEKFSTLFHIDVFHEVLEGVDDLLFNLLILGYLSADTGFVWRKRVTDIYLIETLPFMVKKQKEICYLHQILNILPDTTCRSPKESLELLEADKLPDHDQLFDEKLCTDDTYQRPYQYLLQLENRTSRDIRYDPAKEKGSEKEVLRTILNNCGLKNPSWTELFYFVNFLNNQLTSFESNVFVSGELAGDLPGFGRFVLCFLIHMSRDFATHSLEMSETTPGSLFDKEETCSDDADDIRQFQMRRTWESSPHPYLFFNEDKTTFTFLGFHIDKRTRDVKDLQTNTVLEKNIMTVQLYQALEANGVPLHDDFDNCSRHEKIQRLRNVMGINETHDPDDSYELTTDNVKKMMAIHMRFRCDIPVIVMGETGCGKTRLVKFMCALQIPPGSTLQNMIIMKVHGGTSKREIKRKVKHAQKIAIENVKVNKNMFTVLFFDEANTTESVGLIKEIMCDKRLDGKKMDLCENLKMVAACNPYRKHPDELIKKLEQAGLGYHVDAEETTDRLGRVPMRRLVYRVQPLPQSLLPLVWDFGQLSTLVEKLYIRQMVRRYIESKKVPNQKDLKEVISNILTESQNFMRQQRDECSFVSLRDVDRTLTVMSWFYQQSQKSGLLFRLMDDKIGKKLEQKYTLDDTTRSLVLALGVCYHACLNSRMEYRNRIANFFVEPCKLQNGCTQIEEEINSCQEIFLDNVRLDENIARNAALKENVFMMVVCVELRLPLFLVGKPGSSKSLAKTIVSDAMQGNAAKYEIFKLLKHVQMVSFQCSPLSTPEGIVGTFKQCAQFQEDKDLDTFVSVVVLDEVGLAEDSPRMPLKTLHPLLEDGCEGDEEPKEYMKVAFIGISNWALDPAKMNRGILVQRQVPDIKELKMTASGICQTSKQLESLVEPLIEPMANSYLEVFNKASEEMREFFGLRDFYSLIKMVFTFVDKSKQSPSWFEMVHCIRRNFDGLETVDPLERFKNHLSPVMVIETEPKEADPDCSSAGLIHACLFDTNKMNAESRYLLLITESYGALSIIQQQILSGGIQNRPIIIFGSSFPSDQEYTQVCRNINKIKLCMEAGKTVLLLNLENLYESLYDALNQYYVYFGGDRYVDLGLGTHRVKCTVHKNFRLIVVAEKKTVYKVFPIPLINRLEKHFMNINTMLSDTQQHLVTKLKAWTKDFSGKSEVHVGENFVGYHEDVCSSVVLQTWEANTKDLQSNDEINFEEKVLEDAKTTLLLCATPDAVFRLKRSNLPSDEQTRLSKLYFQDQTHSSFLEYIKKELVTEKKKQLFSQVSTHSKLLGHVHKEEISQESGVGISQILLIESLSSFDTEQQFTGKIQHHLKACKEKPILVIIQCDNGHSNANLIACARFCALDVFEKLRDELDESVHMIFIIHLPRIAGGCFAGFQCGIWQSVHIDDLYPEDVHLPLLYEMQERSVAQLFEDAVRGKNTPNEDEYSDGASLTRIEGLVKKCSQAALVNVKDIDENKEREKLRVQLIMKLIFAVDTDQSISFLHGICQVIAKLLSEKEKRTQCFMDPNEWLTKEATSSDKISEAGTFRRSCLKVLEGKVSPILAGVIAFLDTNQNVDICITEAQNWKKDLWQRILCSSDALELRYSDLQSPTRTSELQEALVLYTGIGKKVFQSKMPFSWLYITKISDLYIAASKTSDDIEKLYQSFVALMREIPLCRILYDVDKENCIEEGLKDYVNDFVSSVYYNGSEDEHKVLCQALARKSVECYRTHGEFTLLNAVACVHMAYHEMSPGLTYFRLINSIWGSCSNDLLALQDISKTDNTLLKNNDITMAAAYLLCDHMSPVKLDEKASRPQSKIDDSTKRTEWLGKVQCYRPVFEKTLFFLEQQAELSDSTSDSLIHIRCQWERIIVMKLFIEHICITREEKTYVNYCMPLWKKLCKLGDGINMKMVEPIQKLEDFMKLINKKHIKDLLGDVNKCSQCERMLDTVPVKLPCGDLVCKGCFQGMKTRDRKCFTCKNVFTEDWEPTTGNQHLKEKEIAIVKGYQKKCNAFFMDMVSQLCFAENSAPSIEVVEKLLSFITFDGSKQSGLIQTKVMSIFDTGIDPTPIFRSFLLQLLLKSSLEDVKKNLDVYLKNADHIIEKQEKYTADIATQQKMGQHIELCLMIIQCLEDIFSQEASKAENEIDYATDALQSVTGNLTREELSVSKLVILAKARMGLTIAAKYLNMELNTTEKKRWNVRVLFNASKAVCNEDCQWPKIFIVKIITRCYGFDKYSRLCLSESDLVNWVSLPEANDDVRVASDRYIVCGDEYMRIRRAVTDIALGGDIDNLDGLLQEFGAENVKTAVYLDLALYREITCANIFPDDRRPVPTKSIAIFEDFISKKFSKEKSDLPLKALKNALMPEELKVEERLDISSQGVQSLLLHYLSILTKLDGNKTLLQPFSCLIQDVESYKGVFLPTMPQDDTEDLKALLLKDIDKKDTHFKQITLYKCPNGHIYLVTKLQLPLPVSLCTIWYI